MARVRSPNYPYVSLQDALARIEQIYKAEHLHKADAQTISKAMGYGGLNGASASVISALRKYGLLDDVDGGYKVSQDALTLIVDPKNSKERAKKIIESAFKPALFAELESEYGRSPPSDENLRAYLLKRGFSTTAVDAPIRNYRETLELVSEAEKIYSPPKEQEQKPPAHGGGFFVDAFSQFSKGGVTPPPAAPSDVTQQDTFTLGEGRVVIQWPSNMSEHSFEDFSDWLTLLHRKIGRSIEGADIQLQVVQKPNAKGKG